jgi:hypothetical protein
VKNQATKCQRAKQVLHVDALEDMTMGDGACGEMMPPNKAISEKFHARQ